MALLIAWLIVLIAVRMQRSHNTFPPIRLPNPALLSKFPEVPTGWATTPIPLYGGVHPHRMTVNFSTGILLHIQTDFYLGDTIPINFTRTYMQMDDASRCFGVGTTNSYDMFLVGDSAPFTYLELILADGTRIYYQRISPGIGYSDAVYRHNPPPGEDGDFFTGSIMRWNGSGWVLRLQDGTLMRFPASKYAKRGAQAALLSIEDAHGELLSINRDSEGNILRIVSPNGGTLTLTHDSHNRIISGVDSRGHSIRYDYDAMDRLIAVHDSREGTTRYTYDGHHNIVSIAKPDGTVWMKFEYDQNNRLSKYIAADGAWVQFNYSADNKGHVIRTVELTSNGYADSYAFDLNGRVVSHQQAFVGAPGGEKRSQANL